MVQQMVHKKSPTILVVEDEPMLRELYTDCLRTGPYEVEQAQGLFTRVKRV